MSAFAGLGVKPVSVYLNDADVRFTEVQLEHQPEPADLIVEAVVQAQDQLQYDEDYDVLAFVHVQDSETSFNTQDIDTQKQFQPTANHGGYLRLAVANKSSVEQVKNHKKNEVWYERFGQRYRFDPAWSVAQKQGRQLFWSLCLLFFSLPTLLSMIWAEVESERLQSRRAVVLQFEKQQERARLSLAQNQAQSAQIKKAKNSWGALLESIQILEQSMPKEANVQHLDWQKQRLQVKGIFPAAQANKVSAAFAALLAKTGFTLQSESESGHGQSAIRFQLTRIW